MAKRYQAFCDDCQQNLGPQRVRARHCQRYIEEHVCDWLNQPYRADPRLGGYEGMQRFWDYLMGGPAQVPPTGRSC